MNKLLFRAKQYAKSDAPILIFGESGTGKELMAQSLHQNSKRLNGPFVPVNCAAIPKDILESELFGYEEGAFTGAKKGGKAGLFELAQGGTIFLDEIGKIPTELQTKLLRVLQEREIIRIGGKELIPLDIRIICATNRPLKTMVENGQFREDLFYRINVLQLTIPPLRERVEDIIPLFKHLLKKHGVLDAQIAFLAELAKTKLTAYPWHGNIRELENFTMRLEALISLQTTNYELSRCFLDVCEEFFENLKAAGQKGSKNIDHRQELESFYSSEIMKALKKHNGNRSLAARELGISRATLWRRLKELGIDRDNI
jgi:propionate catabolism operon transcriptional regulator